MSSRKIEKEATGQPHLVYIWDKTGTVCFRCELMPNGKDLAVLASKHDLTIPTEERCAIRSQARAIIRDRLKRRGASC